MQDFLHRGLVAGQDIRFTYALTTSVANEAVLTHGCDPLAAHMFCRALTGAILTAPLLDDGHRFSIHWGYNGAVSTLIADIGADATVRGMISDPELMEKVETEGDIYGSQGLISVIRTSATQKLNSGIAQAGLLDVVEDLAFYFSTSDQNETAITVLVGFNPQPENPVSLCQGLLLQALPSCDLERFDRVRNAMQASTFRDLLSQQPEADNHIERLIQALQSASGESIVPPVLHDCPPPTYHCGCNSEKTLAVLSTLSAEELREAIATGERLTVRCHFCSKAYTFGPADLQRVLDQS